MNICQLGYSEVKEGNFYNGGAKVNYQFAQYFRAQGHTVVNYHLFTREEYKNLVPFLKDNHIDVAIWHMSTLKLKGSIKLPCPLFCLFHNDPNATLSNYAQVFCEKYHVWSPLSTLLQTKICSKILFNLHSVFNQLMFCHVTRYATKMVLLSEGFKKGFWAAKLFPHKVIAIPNSIEIPENTSIPKKKNNVIYVGRLRKEKRLDLLLKIWAKVEPTHQDWNLVIVGDGPEAGYYQSLASELGITRCQWTGWCTDPTPYYKEAKIIAMTSDYEGFPCVLLEASIYGTVPILFDTFASAEDIVTNGINGSLVLPNDIDAFASKLQHIMDDEYIYTSMSHAAIENAHRFSQTEVMKEWDELIASTNTIN